MNKHLEDEDILHSELFKAFYGDGIEVYKRFRYTDYNKTKIEIDHCIIDRHSRLLVIFGDKSFQNCELKSANRAVRDNIKQNRRMLESIDINKGLLVNTSHGKMYIDISNIDECIQFNVIYRVYKENGSKYIIPSYSLKATFNLNNNESQDYRQPIITYHSLLRILEYCHRNKIGFSKFISIMEKIYLSNPNGIDFGIGMHSAFAYTFESELNPNIDYITIVIAEELQNTIRIVNRKHKFFTDDTFKIKLSHNYNIIKSDKPEIECKLISLEKYRELVIDAFKEYIDLVNISQILKERQRDIAKHLLKHKYHGVIIHRSRIITLSKSDITNILEYMIR